MFPLLETAIAFAAVMLTASLLVSALVQGIQSAGGYRSDTVSGMLRSVIHGFRSFYNDPDALTVDYPDPENSSDIEPARGRVFAGERAFVKDIMADPTLHARGDALTYGDDPARQAQYVEYISASDLIAIARNHAEYAATAPSSDPVSRMAEVSSPRPPPAESGSQDVLTRPGDELRFLPASWLYAKGGAENAEKLRSEKPYATLAKFTEYVQHWYPTFEATASQAFKNKIRRLTRFVACSLVVLLNIDSVGLAITLHQNSGGSYAQRIPELRQQAELLGVTQVDVEPTEASVDVASADDVLTPSTPAGGVAVPASSVAPPAPSVGGVAAPARSVAPPAPSVGGVAVPTSATPATPATPPTSADPLLLLNALADPTLGLGWQGSKIVDIWCAHTDQCPSSMGSLNGWQVANATILWLFGLLLSCALLSLGAPFWYNALAGLLNLKSAVQTKNEQADVAKGVTPSEKRS
ncbi:MAG TPA: hypothetical protein VHM25_15870 [Polyangiaceae bacterium]|nr:hypothetical protein [Polyangiaceae bacterium]